MTIEEDDKDEQDASFPRHHSLQHQQQEEPPTRRVISASKSRRELMRQVSGLGMEDPVFDKDRDIQKVLQERNIFADDPKANLDFSVDNVNGDATLSVASDKTANVHEGNGLNLRQFHESLSAQDSIIFGAAPKPLHADDDAAGMDRKQHDDLPSKHSEEIRVKKSNSKSKSSKDKSTSSLRSSKSPSRKTSRLGSRRTPKTKDAVSSSDLNMSTQSLDLDQILQMEKLEHSTRASASEKPQSHNVTIGKSGRSSSRPSASMSQLQHSKSSLNQSKSTITKSKHSTGGGEQRKSSSTKPGKSSSSSKDKSRSKKAQQPVDSEMDQLIREAALAYNPSNSKDNDLLFEALQSSHTSLDAVNLLSLDDKQGSLRSFVDGSLLQQHQQESNTPYFENRRSPTISIGKTKVSKGHRAMPDMQQIFQTPIADETPESSIDRQQLSVPEQRSATIKALVSTSHQKRNSPAGKASLSIVSDNADSHKVARPTKLPERVNLLDLSASPTKRSKSKKTNKLSSSFNAISKKNSISEATTASSSAPLDESPQSLASSSTSLDMSAIDQATPGRARRLLNSLHMSSHFGRADVSQSPARQRGSSRSQSRGRSRLMNSVNNMSAHFGRADVSESPARQRRSLSRSLSRGRRLNRPSEEIKSPSPRSNGKLKGLLGRLKDDDDVAPRRKGKGIFNKSFSSLKNSPGNGSNHGISLRSTPGLNVRNGLAIKLPSPPQPQKDPDMESPRSQRRTLMVGLQAKASLVEL
ncbi:hypothetical protein MPSEU_000039900 [Mayamaea pseudoterrestris]|nr:hypothetical protein MPSEU_000039900 [Mayamaea pseudoterrestris]